MKKLLGLKSSKVVFFILGLGIITVAMSIVVTNSNITASVKGPKIYFKETEHNFGKVPQGPSLQYNFKFTNKGNETLKIERVQTSCGCTGATVGEKTEYEKNESGEIKVEFNTQGRQGTQEKTIIVFSNDPNDPQLALKITCEIDPNMEY